MSGEDTNPQQQQRYPCPVCGNTFTRPQHVVRHLRSHTGERPYKCKECGDAFARSDLLSRHVNKCHPTLANSGPPQSGKHPKRRACENCAHTGSRCDSKSPCSSCVEQDVSCSRMPKATGSTPSHLDSRSSLNSTVPSFTGHRRNISGSDWSSDSSSRSRSSQYSQPSTSGFGFQATPLDGLSTPRNPPGSSVLPVPWPPGASASQLDQSTLTPSQVRAMYGGSLPTGYTHPSQFSSVGGGINLPNPASLPPASGLDSFDSFTLMNYGNTQRTNAGSATGQSTFGTSGAPNHLSLASGWKDYAGQGQQQQQASYGSQPSRSSYNAPMPSGTPITYSYEAIPEFAHHNVQGAPQGAYAAAHHQHHQGAESGANSASPSGGNSTYTTTGANTGTAGPHPPRPSLPGLDSIISATFPSVDNTGSTVSPSTVTTNPGMAYLYGRGADRRGSVASSGSALSDSVSTPSSMAFQPPSPSDGSRPTSSSSVSYGPLPSTFGGLQLRGSSGGNVPDGNPSSSSLSTEVTPGDSRTGSASGTSEKEVGGASEAERSRLRQIWSSWITTPLSATTEKDAFILSNAAPTPLGHPPAGGAGGHSGSQTAENTMFAALPPHMYPSKQGQYDQQPSALQKSMSLPAIRTPNLERRMIGDVPTPRVHNNQTYNMPDLRRYQQACLARETPSLTLAPRLRGPHTPGADSNPDGTSNSPSPTSGSSGGSGQSGYIPIRGGAFMNVAAGNLHTISPTSRSGSSQSGGSSDGYCQPGPNAGATTIYQYGPPAISEPDPRCVKLNTNSTEHIGQTYSSQARPSYKRLASQTLGPELSKRTAVSGRGGGDDGTDRCDDVGGGGNGDVFGYEIPDPPPPITRKRSNSSPTYNSVNFQPLPPFSAGTSAATGHGNSAVPPLPAPAPHPYYSHAHMSQN